MTLARPRAREPNRPPPAPRWPLQPSPLCRRKPGVDFPCSGNVARRRCLSHVWNLRATPEFPSTFILQLLVFVVQFSLLCFHVPVCWIVLFLPKSCSFADNDFKVDRFSSGAQSPKIRIFFADPTRIKETNVVHSNEHDVCSTCDVSFVHESLSGMKQLKTQSLFSPERLPSASLTEHFVEIPFALCCARPRLSNN